jgi:predicted NAD/FAD-binding protein
VHNERTYPNLLRIFRELGIATQTTEMSMSISCTECGLQYAGGRGLKGIAAQPLRLLSPRFITMLINVPRFFKQAHEVLASDTYNELTWGDFLRQNNFSPYFIKHFAIPLVSCVWSAGDEDSLDYPAKHLFEFLGHHGMLTLGNSPTWRTIVGGSQMYVNAIIEKLSDVHTDAGVTSVKRFENRVEVTTTKGVQTFDYAIIATHANTALEILVDADIHELEALGNIRYSANQTWLHKDESVLPHANGARASWNYKIDSCSQETENVLVSYWMNKLMLLDTQTPYLVTLNGQEALNENLVVAKMNYEHPIFTLDAIKAAGVLRAAGGPRLAFAGAHLGWGFHEDGARSGVEAARKFGATW